MDINEVKADAAKVSSAWAKAVAYVAAHPKTTILAAAGVILLSVILGIRF